MDVQYPGTFCNEDFCILATYSLIYYMHLILQGALNFPGSSFIEAETAAETRGTFELCGLGVELRQIQKVLHVLLCTYDYFSQEVRNSSLLFR